MSIHLPTRPKSDSSPREAIWAQLIQNNLTQSLFQPMLRLISAPRYKSAPGNWAVLALIKGAKLDPKNRTVF